MVGFGAVVQADNARVARRNGSKAFMLGFVEQPLHFGALLERFAHDALAAW